MKRILHAILFTGLTQLAVAQVTVTDSVQAGDGVTAYANDVYYSLKLGKMKTASNKEWQLAFSVGTFNVAVRANTVTSSSGDGSVTIYEHPDQDTTKWASFDPTGYEQNWMLLDNSDQDWEQGAFNVNAGGSFDYGWGMYDQSTHIVTGNRLYLVVLKTGGSTVLKKLWIVNKDFGTWNIRYANVDGSNQKEVQLKSSDYNGKNFAYLSLVTDAVVDHEPVAADWDFVLTRYAGWQPQGQYYPVTGILTNMGVYTGEVRGKDETTTTLADTIYTSDTISTIGSDWKQFDLNENKYVTLNNLSYFVKAKDGAFWKLVFTKFDMTNGNVVFNKTKLTTSVAVNDVEGKSLKTAVYPNPSSDVMQVVFESAFAQSQIMVTDLTGKTMITETENGSGFRNHTLDVSGLAKGIYLLNVNSGDNHTVQKIIVN